MNHEQNDTPATPESSPTPKPTSETPAADVGAEDPYKGMDVSADGVLAGTASPEIHDAVVGVMKETYDPEIPVNIYDLGMVYKIQTNTEGDAFVTMTLTSPNCPVVGTLPGEVEAKVDALSTVNRAKVELVWDPPWTMEMMTEAAKLQLGFV